MFYSKKDLESHDRININVLENIPYVYLNNPVLCLDSDNFYTYDIIEEWNGENKIFTFKDCGENPIYSYIKLGNNETIQEIREKERISELACCGAYGFSNVVHF